MVVLVAGVEVIIKTPRERCADTADLLEISGTGPQHALQSPEMAQQRAPFGGSQAGDRLQNGFVIAARAPAAMTGDGKSMSFIAYALDVPRSRRMRLEHER
jgi:hypothetical protein